MQINAISPHKKLGVFLFCCGFLLFFRPQALFYPPYWDSIMGPFHEALWLSENHFDFFQLAQMPGYKAGGPNIYFFSLYPSFQAIFMLLLSKQSSFLLFNHLLSIMLSSGIVYMLYEMLSENFGHKMAFGGCLCLFFHPLFLSQAYAINMEIPTLFFGLAGISCFLKKQDARAGLFLLLSFYTKESGLLFSLAILPLFLFCRLSKEKKAHLVLYFLPVLLFFLQNLIKKYYFISHGGDGEYKEIYSSSESIFFFSIFILSAIIASLVYRQKKQKEFSFLPFVLVWALFLTIMMVSLKGNLPRIWEIADIYFLIAIACLLCFGLLTYEYCIFNKDIKAFCQEHLVILFSLIFCNIFLTASYMLTHSLPRYFLICFPFIFSLLAWISKRLKPFFLCAVFALILIFYAANMYGNVYESIYGKEAIYLQHGALLESTLKYEDDMEANLALIKALEKYPQAIFVASYPTAHKLVSPKLGYVKEEKKFLTHDRFFFSWRWVLNLADIHLLDKEAKRRLVWICHKNHCLIEPYQKEKGDRLLETIKIKDREIQIFQRKMF